MLGAYLQKYNQENERQNLEVMVDNMIDGPPQVCTSESSCTQSEEFITQQDINYLCQAVDCRSQGEKSKDELGKAQRYLYQMIKEKVNLNYIGATRKTDEEGVDKEAVR